MSKQISFNLVNEILSDTEDRSDELLDYYERASDRDKEVIDKTFMYLCGWTFTSLVATLEDICPECEHLLQGADECPTCTTL